MGKFTDLPASNYPKVRAKISGPWRKEEGWHGNVLPQKTSLDIYLPVEIEAGKGVSVQDACRKLSICEQAYYRWKREYGGLRVDQAKRLKNLEHENARLKKLVADLSLDKVILQEVAPLFIEPGSPWENGYVESFNGKLRDEVLNGEIFFTLPEAQIIIERWRRQYNTHRPHSALGYQPPAPEPRTLTELVA